jgi:uncharacterized protein
MAKSILITGASGMIGSRLTALLIAAGNTVRHLSRSPISSQVSTFGWNPDSGFIDTKALHQTDVIIHLAGAGIGDKRWNMSRKKEILESRTKSTELLNKALKNSKHHVETFMSASAIGYYGFGGANKIFNEADPAGADFLAQVTQQWEGEVDKLVQPGLRVVKLRIGVVLSSKGGALRKIAKPIKLGIGAPLGSGLQFLSWIHVDDLCNLFIKAIEDEKMNGVYNATTDWCTNEELTKAIARILHKPLWVPSIPSFVLNIILGEMADLVLGGSKASPEKIKQAGYQCRYANLDDALNNLLS